MIVHRDIKQGSLEWMCLRAGIPTASAFKNIVTPKFEIRKGEMPATYLATLLAEKWQGGPLPSFGSGSTEQGSMQESEAFNWFNFEFGIETDRIGFCTTDDGLIGASPDALIGEDGGLEVKCLEATHHVKCLLDGGLPDDFAAQVHGSLFVTGRPWWKFLAYRRHFPPLVLTIERDEEIIEKLSEALAMFLAKFQSAMKRMEEINGGPSPASRPPTSFAETKRAARAQETHVSPEPVTMEFRD